MPSLNSALLDAQRAMPSLQRDKINPHFGASYLSLEGLMGSILPVLNENGMVLTQLTTTLDDGSGGLTTRLTHVETGETIESTMPLIMDKQNAQAQGSAITYARRYSLMALLGLVADEDDDGNAASPAREKKTSREDKKKGF
jgi:hypothetical protein